MPIAMDRIRTAVLSLLVLLGCGGGSDGSWLSFSPSTVEIQAFQGESGRQLLEATSPQLRGYYGALFLVDERFTLGLSGSIGEGHFSWNLESSPALAAGTYRGEIEIRVCEDDPRECSTPMSGSPWHVPYTITIIGPDLRPLTPVAGLTPWTTWGGTAAHLPYLPTTFDPAVFDRRWWFDPTGGEFEGISDVAVGWGRVFEQTRPVAFPTDLPRVLHAYDEATGQELWSRSFGDENVSDPALADERVYVVTRDTLWTLDATDGSVVRSTPLPPSPIEYDDRGFTLEAPTPTAGGVLVPYRDSFAPNGLARFDADGVFQRLITTSTSILPPSPIVRGGVLFVARYQYLDARDPVTGDTLWSVSVTDPSWGEAPLALTDGLVCTSTGTQCVDTVTRSVSAFALPAGRTLLAAGNGVAYAGMTRSTMDANLASVEAYDLATGELRWSWSSDANLDRRALLTGAALFLSRDYDTVALDLTTHEVVWSVPYTGSLAISENAVLYIVNDTGNNYAPRLMAWNLR